LAADRSKVLEEQIGVLQEDADAARVSPLLLWTFHFESHAIMVKTMFLPNE
jgi:hypothetical protein